MNGYEIHCKGGGDMHRSAIDADDKAGMAQQPNKLQKCCLIRKLDAVLRRREFSMLFSDNNNASRRERATKLLDYHGRNRFAAAPGVRVQNNETREWVEAREGIA